MNSTHATAHTTTPLAIPALQTMAHRILLVDDDEFLRTTLAAQLEREGFQVRAVADGTAMFTALARFDPDLVLLDVRLPGDDGLTLMRKLREQRATPVILLTAKCDTLDKVIGLELGADDYVTKPFETRELVARLHARLRAPGVAGAAGLGRRSFDGWTVDLDAHELCPPEGGQIALTTHEFKALAAFVNNVGRVLSRDQLMDSIVGREWLPSDRSVDVLVAKLRRRLRDDAKHPRLIKTVHGAGYMFAAKVTRA
jgi:DNA-binding response OmpR family regulator